MTELEPHQKRVVEEKKDLDAKIEKLGPFLQTKIFQGLPAIERIRLARQHDVMREYSTILGQRIDWFNQGAV